ncbi:MAG: hypothetical protein HKN79_07840 [Flavobacteriales bacterium]|nr:hypothetical protein [Flavobacteriales bacterium]
MRHLILFLSLLCVYGLLAQSPGAARDSILGEMYAAIMEQEDDEARMKASEAFKQELRSTLFKEGAFHHPFETLNMCKKTAPDGRFRIFNWNIPLSDGTEFYEALVIIPKNRSGMVDVMELKDASEDMDRPQDKVLRPDKWFGALYYDIIPFKKGGGDHYVLLGWDGDSPITNRKVIDVITLSGKNIRFGAPVFRTDKGTKKRLLFTYGEQLSMSLIYQDKEGRIIFDHLAPRESRLEGQFQFYGPDMSFDALNYKKGRWEWESNIEFKRKRTPKDKEFNDPRVK